MEAGAQRARPLSAFDAQFLAAETGGPMVSNYCALAVVAPGPGGPLTLELVRALVARRIDHIPALRWRLAGARLGLDHPSFVDGPVDVARHVIGSTLTPPGTREDLAEAAGALMAEPLDRAHPLWEFHVIDGLEDDRVAVAMKFHHAAADALAAATIMALMMDMDPDPDRRDDLPPKAPLLSAPGAVEEFTAGLRRAVTHPLRAAKATANALPYLDQVPMMRGLPGAEALGRVSGAAQRLVGREADGAGNYDRAPRARFNGRLSGGRSIAFGSVDLASVKRRKDAAGVTFNDVVVAAVGGGLRRYLAEHGEVPDRPLMAFVPFNVRGEDGEGEIRNAISSFIAPVPSHLDDGDARLRAAARGMDEAKARHAAAPTTLLEDANDMVAPVVFGAMASGLLWLVGSGLVDLPVNMVLSNVPGPTERWHLAGHEVETIGPLSLIFDGASLNVTVASYVDRLEIGVVADPELTPDPWRLLSHLGAEFTAMGEA